MTSREWTEGAGAGEGKTLERRIRAFHWIRLLAAVSDRRAGSAGEREAAERVESWMREVGLEDVGPFEAVAEPEIASSLALHGALAALGCALSGWIGLALVGLALSSFRRDRIAGRPMLSRWLRRPSARSVLGRAGAREPRRRVVLSASLDAPPAGGIFPASAHQSFGIRRLAALPPARLCERGLQAAAWIVAASLLGASGALFSALQWGLTAALGLGVAAALRWRRAATGPCANDASGLAALLTCTEQLLPQLCDDAELWVVAGGGGAAGAAGLREILDRHPEWSSDRCVLLHFDRVGGGALHYLRSESAYARSEYPTRLRELARRLAEGGAYREVTPIDFVGETAARLPAARGLHALALLSLDPDGAPRGDRDEADLPESLDMETVVRAADFAAAIVAAGWRGDSDPLAIV